MKNKDEKSRFKLTVADLFKYSKPRLGEIRKDEDSFAWWRGLLESKEFNRDAQSCLTANSFKNK